MEKIDNITPIISRDFNSNAYIFNDILVDPGTPSNIDYLLENIKLAGLSIDNINKIVNTHCHFDHTGADEYLQKEFGLEVYLHKLDADAIIRRDGEETVASHFGCAVPDIDVKIIEEGDKFYDFEVIHTPGHTHGSICLYNGQSLISGDTVFSEGSFGRSDFKTGSQTDLNKSLKRLAELDVSNLFTGHGPYVEANANQHIALSSRTASMYY